MGCCRRNGFVSVFPPELHGVVLVIEHGVGGVAWAPTVAAYSGVAVESRPFPNGHPCVIRLAAVPSILLESRVVSGVPDVLFADNVVSLCCVNTCET